MSTPTPQHPTQPGAPASPRANPNHSRLIGLNIALLLILAVVTFANSSRVGAQPASGGGGGSPSGRSRGEYTMVAGRTQGATTAVIYILDANNQEVVALGWDRTNNRIEPVGLRTLTDDAKYLTKPR